MAVCGRKRPHPHSGLSQPPTTVAGGFPRTTGGAVDKPLESQAAEFLGMTTYIPFDKPYPPKPPVCPFCGAPHNHYSNHRGSWACLNCHLTAPLGSATVTILPR